MARGKNPLRILLNPNRILIPILLGLSVAGFLLVRNLGEVHFEKVADGRGNYEWLDTGGGGKADLNDENQFREVEPGTGTYRKLTYKEIVFSANWTRYSAIWLVLSLTMMAVRDVAYMYRIRVLTNNGLSWRQAFDVIMLWEFASSVTPSAVGGSAVAIFILNREGLNLGKSTTIVLITSLLDELFFIFMIPLLMLGVGVDRFFPATAGAESSGWLFGTQLVFFSSYLIILSYCILISYGILINPQGFKWLLSKTFHLPVLKRWEKNAEMVGNEIVTASKELRGKGVSYWMKASLSTFFSWTARYWVVNFLLLAFIAVDNHLLLYARQLVIWVIMLISPTPGASGVAEFAFSEYLNDMIPEALVLPLAFMWRLISYYPYLIIGGVIIPRWVRRVYLKRRLIKFRNR